MAELLAILDGNQNGVDDQQILVPVELPPRIYRPRMNALDMLSDNLIRKEYRLPRVLILQLVDELRDTLAPTTKRSQSVSAELQVSSLGTIIICRIQNRSITCVGKNNFF